MKDNVIGVSGWKNSGKTTLVEALVAELSRRGRSVSTVKHAHHSFDVDHDGTDSFRHRKAGAREVMIVSQRRWALMHESHGEDEPVLDDILARLAPVDVVLVEGYKNNAQRKIETRRLEAKDTISLSAQDETVIAIAADHPLPGETLPVFGLGDIGAIADFIEQAVGLAATNRTPGH